MRAAEMFADLAREWWQLTWPAAPSDWCERAGVTLRFADQMVEGRYTWAAQPEIILRPHDQGSRATFTLAHELGHHILEQSRQSTAFRRDLPREALSELAALIPASADEEDLCDHIAFALLIDRDAAESWLATHRDDDIAALIRLASGRGLTVSETWTRLFHGHHKLSALLKGRRRNSRWLEVTSVVSNRGTLPGRGSILSSEVAGSGHAAWYEWTSKGARLRVRGGLADVPVDDFYLLLSLTAGSGGRQGPRR